MSQVTFKTLEFKNLIRVKTGLLVLARWTFVYTNVIALQSPCSRMEGSASELGFLETKDFSYGT
jgi:hypothetical protein